MISPEMIATKEMGELELGEPGAQNTWRLTTAVIVDTPAAVKSLVDTLAHLQKSFGSVYMDLEGVNLSRHGSISLIQILAPSCEQAFIVDIHNLGMTAFDTIGCEGKSLKDALESKTIKKYLFDVRNDSDALYALFGVRLAGVVDVQLLELASRKGMKHALCGLAKCIEQEQALPSQALLQWQNTKKDVIKKFDPKLGGTYEVFNVRPLPQVLIDYCVGDVEFLPLLSTIYQNRMSCHWSEKARVETEKRLEESRSLSYKHHGRQKSLGPKSWRFPPKRETRSNVTVAASAPCGSTPLAGQKALAQSTFHESDLRHQPVVSVPEGGENGGKGRESRSKRSLASPYSDVSFRYTLYDGNEQNWALCDKDCGWCGHCGDGII